MLLFVGLTVAAWFVIWRVYRRSRLPIPKQLDEIGGAILGLVYVGLFISLQLVILDSFFLSGGEGPGWLTALLRRAERLADRRLLPRDRHPDRRLRHAPLRSRRDRRSPLMTGRRPKPAFALEAAWFDRPAASLAIDLLGSRLVRDAPEGRVGGRIVEVEAYRGPEDLAAHSVARSRRRETRSCSDRPATSTST